MSDSLDLLSVLSPGLFAGRPVFVTGGGSGINLGIAHGFASLGADVGLCGRNAERLGQAAASLERLGVRVVTAVADVRDYDAVVEALELTRRSLGPISVLVCGAAGNFPCPAEELSANGFKSVVEIDLLGSFNACRAGFDQLKETRGSIVVVSAGQATVAYPAQAHVGAAKAGVEQLMRTLALEWGRFGIRVNAVVPGPIEGTEGMRRLVPDDPKLHGQLRAAIPLGRYGAVEDVAAATVFLASPLARWVTGTTLTVDGGQNLAGSGVFATLIGRALAGR